MKFYQFPVVVLILLLSPLAHSAEVCITGVNGEMFSMDQEWSHGEKLYKAAYTCQELDNITTGIEATSIALGAVGIYTACLGMVPATVFLEGGALILNSVSLVVSNLDCVDTDSEAKIKEMMDDAVCNALQRQGIQCIPPLEQESGVLL